jgi:hypothetical protein
LDRFQKQAALLLRHRSIPLICELAPALGVLVRLDVIESVLIVVREVDWQPLVKAEISKGLSLAILCPRHETFSRDSFHPSGVATHFRLLSQDCVRRRELVLGYFLCLPTGGSAVTREGSGSARVSESRSPSAALRAGYGAHRVPPLRGWEGWGNRTQGCAALHPGLFSLPPYGRQRSDAAGVCDLPQRAPSLRDSG